MTNYYDVQVKSVRESGYIFFPKDKFNLRKNLLAAIVIFNEGFEPQFTGESLLSISECRHSC